MDLSKYTALGQKIAAYLTSKPYIYQPLLFLVNVLALLVGIARIPLTLYRDWKE